MSRTTASLALAQTLLVVLGFFGLGIVLKVSGYPDYIGVRWNPLAVSLRQHGMWLIFLPILWVILATRAERHDRGILSYRVVWLAGVCIAGSIIALFLYAAIFPYSFPIVIQIRQGIR
jgi:hypothetical protein